MTDAAESIITPELRSWIGRRSPLASLEIVSASDVRRYVDATGDANPLWLDDEFARAAGYPSRLLPPTLVGWVPFSMKEGDTASRYDTIDLRRRLPLPDDYTNVRNAGAETEWLQPAYVGEQLSMQGVIVDITTRQGRAGLGIYVTQEEQIFNSRQEMVMRRRHTTAVFPAKKFSTEKKEAD
ncbi:MAG TPA: MaoC family dehydratase N-terminal domain-containing protein [Candidatus Acidoferrales bacterium]|nr:MaoC family dehydratase N-terminal domain-containing protein [Candidatus Acidoferrales bacterium]